MSSNASFSQMTSSPTWGKSSVSNDATKKTSAIKPTDGIPYKFSSQEDLEIAVPKKIDSIKEQILSGKLTEVQVKEAREKIWRLENATVKNKTIK